MTRYLTQRAADAATIYRSVDVASRAGGADGHGLVAMLYDELLAALRTAAWATEHGNPVLRNARVTRALAILFALEAGLDFDKGGAVSQTLATVYHGARQTLADASLGHDPLPFRRVAAQLADIADAWATLKAG